jgi:hypothetical protein
MMHDIPELDAKGLRSFALTTGGIVVALFGLLLPWLLDLGFPIWPWVLAAVLGVWGLAAPATLRPVYRGWMRFGLLASRITTPIILGIVFYVVSHAHGAGHAPVRARPDAPQARYGRGELSGAKQASAAGVRGAALLRRHRPI